MKKLLLLVNPKAGQRKASRFLADIIDVFNRSGYTVITHITWGPGDGASAVARYAKEVDLVIYFIRKIKERGLISEMINILNDVDDLIFRDEEWICSDR